MNKPGLKFIILEGMRWYRGVDKLPLLTDVEETPRVDLRPLSPFEKYWRYGLFAYLIAVILTGVCRVY